MFGWSEMVGLKWCLIQQIRQEIQEQPNRRSLHNGHNLEDASAEKINK